MGKNLKEVETKITKIFFGKKKTPANFKKKDIFTLSRVDSVAIIKIILTLEKTFNIQLSDKDIFSKKFRTISGIVTIVFKKLSKR